MHGTTHLLASPKQHRFSIIIFFQCNATRLLRIQVLQDVLPIWVGKESTMLAWPYLAIHGIQSYRLLEIMGVENYAICGLQR